MEMLRDIPGYEGLYAVTEDGRIWSHAGVKARGRVHHRGRWMRPGLNSAGYLSVVLHCGDGGKSMTIHRAVASTWVPNPDPSVATEINHIDGVKTHNHASNLEWCTRSENQRHANRLGLVKRNPIRFLTFEQAEMVRAKVLAGTRQKDLAAQLGTYAVADPRHAGPPKHSNEFRIVPWSDPSCAVTSAHGTGQGVADPRPTGEVFGKYAVTAFDDSAGTVISGSTSGQGAFAVADPRSGIQRGKGDHYLTAGHYGVTPWTEPAGAVSAAAGHDNGRWSVADPRMPTAAEKLVCRIRALDGTWHRPFTTLELAALQSLVDPEEHLELDGLSDQAWRERIGNAVPSDAAEQIGNVIGTTLLLAWSGETFMLSSQPIWVRDVAVALTVRGAV